MLSVYIASVIGWLMNIEWLVEWKLAGEIKVLWDNLPSGHFVDKKSEIYVLMVVAMEIVFWAMTLCSQMDIY
jgi:hypothetical protein